MKKSHLTTAAWICLAACAFTLGWTLKPQGSPNSESVRTARATSISPASAMPSERSSAHHAQGNFSNSQEFAQTPATAAPLTSKSILALGDELRSTRDPLKRHAIMAKLLAGLTAENALEMRKQIEDLADTDPAFKDFHFAWGQVAGAEAVLHGFDTEKADVDQAMVGWTSADPTAAKAWYDSPEEKTEKTANRDRLKEALVRGLAIADASKAADFVMGLGQAGDPKAKQMMSVLTNGMLQSGASQAASWAAALPAGELRGQALYEIARAQAREDPAAAAAWAGQFAGDKNGGNIIYGISSEWGWRNGAAAVNWLDSLGGNQSAAYGPALAGWAKSDPLAASQHIAAMPPSDSRDQAIGGLVSSYRWEDPVSSITWANEIRDTQSREKVLTMTAEAYLRKDPTAAVAWLPTSGLSAEAQQRLISAKK